MKICGACCQELSKEQFSKKQWQLKQYQRRCKECIAVGKELQPPSKNNVSTKQADDGEENTPSCWICLEKGEAEDPLRRECSCRGDSAGYAHLSCIVEYATHKFETYLEDMEKIPCPWETCPTCLQDYTNDLAIDLAKAYVLFAEKNYAGQPTIILRSYVILLESLTSKHWDKSPKQYAEARKIANTIISKAKHVKSTMVREYEAFAYEILGCMLLEEERKEDLEKMLQYFEKSIKVYKEVGLSSRIVQLEGYVGIAKTRIGDGNNAEAETALKHCSQTYQYEIQTSGESSDGAILRGGVYARELKRSNYGVKAEKLLNKLYEICLRTHGPDHERYTKHIQYKRDRCCTRYLTIRSKADYAKPSNSLTVEDIDGGETFYCFVQYDDSFYTLTVEGPFSRVDPNLQSHTMLTTNDNVIFALGTPVFSHDAATFGKLGDIIAWNHETGCYTIRWEDDALDACEVHHKFIRVPRCACIPWNDNPFPIDPTKVKVPKTPEEDERMMRKAKLAYDKEVASNELNTLTKMASQLSWS